MNKEGKRHIINNKLISAVLIILMLLSLTSCMPQWYTDADIAKFEREGKAEVTKWLEKNIPGASLDEASIKVSYDPFGVDDIVYGEYELNGETIKFMFVRGSEGMYTDAMYHTATEAVAKMYAEGFGLENYRVDYKDDYKNVSFYVEYKKYADKKGDGNFEVSDENSFFEYVPYDLTEDELNDFLENESKRCNRYHGSGIDYVIDSDELKATPEMIKYLRDHPFFDSFDIYNKTMDSSIHLTVDYNDDNDAPDSIEVWYYYMTTTTATASDGEPISYLERDSARTKIYDFNTLTLKQD